MLPKKWKMLISVPSPEGLTLPPAHSHPPQLSQVPIPRISASHPGGKLPLWAGRRTLPRQTLRAQTAPHKPKQPRALSKDQPQRSTNSLFGSSFPGEQTKAGRFRSTWKTPPDLCPSLAGHEGWPQAPTRQQNHHKGGTAHKSPWEESVPRLAEAGNDRRNFFHAESGSDGAAVAALPPRRASGAGGTASAASQLSCFPAPSQTGKWGCRAWHCRG